MLGPSPYKLSAFGGKGQTDFFGDYRPDQHETYPRKEEFDDEFDYRAASILWHHETKRAIAKWKSEGLIIDI